MDKIYHRGGLLYFSLEDKLFFLKSDSSWTSIKRSMYDPCEISMVLPKIKSTKEIFKIWAG